MHQPEAVNYEPSATEDDGSCLVPGCRYPAAVNFNPLANVDDGTCQYEVHQREQRQLQPAGLRR